MAAVVAVETVLLVLLLILVVGLLRSHAEILRRLGPAGEAEGDDLAPSTLRSPDIAPARGDAALVAAPLSGTTLQGDPVALAFDGPAAGATLLAFLSSGCTSCVGFWERLGEPLLPPGVRPVIVTRSGDRERIARLRTLAPAGVPVVMSTAAWDDYAVPGTPYFVLVDGHIRGEGVETTWDAVASLVADAIEDEREQAAASGGGEIDLDAKLIAAGIGPDHPSLYPAGPPPRP